MANSLGGISVEEMASQMLAKAREQVTPELVEALKKIHGDDMDEDAAAYFIVHSGLDGLGLDDSPMK